MNASSSHPPSSSRISDDEGDLHLAETDGGGTTPVEHPSDGDDGSPISRAYSMPPPSSSSSHQLPTTTRTSRTIVTEKMQSRSINATGTAATGSGAPPGKQLLVSTESSFFSSFADSIASPLNNLIANNQEKASRKGASMEQITELFSVPGNEETGLGVKGFDPTRWIIAAGVLEKKRDGRVREGYAKRFFILSKDTLFYYLLPEPDVQGFEPLVGVERGQIKLADVNEVVTGQDKDYVYLTITVGQVKKRSATGILSLPVSTVTLRAPMSTGHLWAHAILAARNALRQGKSPPRPNSQKFPLRSFPASDSDLETLGTGVRGGGTSSPVATTTTATTATLPPLLIPASTPDLRPLEEMFPFSSAPPITMMLALLALTNALFFATSRANAGWLARLVLWFLMNGLMVFVFFEIQRRTFVHDSVAREARVALQRMREHTKHLQHIVSNVPSVPSPLTRMSSAPPKPLFGMMIGGGGGNTDRIPSPVTPTTASILEAGSTVPKSLVGTPGLMSWAPASSEDFKVRIGPDYKKNGKKAPSGESFYDMIAMDLVRSTKARVVNVVGTNRVTLPLPRPGVDNVEAIAKSGLPRLFVVNCLLPDKSPPLVGKPEHDPGYSLIFYFAVKPETVSAWNSGQASPALKITHRYFHECEKNPDIRRRFKGIGMVDKADDLGVPMASGFVKKFNGKPVIFNKVAYISMDKIKNDWFEIDLDFHEFPYMAKKMLYALKDRTTEMRLTAGFVIQGEDDDELPEIIIGGSYIVGLDFRLAKVLVEGKTDAEVA